MVAVTLKTINYERWNVKIETEVEIKAKELL